jgi:hypothetical protein
MKKFLIGAALAGAMVFGGSIPSSQAQWGWIPPYIDDQNPSPYSWEDRNGNCMGGDVAPCFTAPYVGPW